MNKTVMKKSYQLIICAADTAAPSESGPQQQENFVTDETCTTEGEDFDPDPEDYGGTGRRESHTVVDL